MLHPDPVPTQSEPVYAKDLRMQGGCLSPLLGLFIVVPTLIVGAVFVALLGGSRHHVDWRWLPVPVAIILGQIGVGALGVQLGLAKRRRVRSLVQAKCERVYGIDLSDSIHVGISPGWATRSYDGDVDWDVGFLLLERGRIVYYGDRTSFELRGDQIQGVEVSSYSDTLMARYPRIDLVWQGSPESKPKVLGIDPRAAHPVRELWTQALDLSTELSVLRGPHPEASVPDRVTLGLPPTESDAESRAQHEERLSTFERSMAGIAEVGVWVPMMLYFSLPSRSPYRTVPLAGAAFLSMVGLRALVGHASRYLARRHERRFMQRWGITLETRHQGGPPPGR